MIALDAMGGDTAPYSVVWGAIRAAQKGVPVVLFGQEELLLKILDECPAWKSLPLDIVHCTSAISMSSLKPRLVLKEHDSSLMRALESVASGLNKAVVSAGNSGAALVGGIFHLGKVEGIDRPAIGNFIPTEHGSLFCLDLGANTDCKPEYLEQFAFMGHTYVRLTKKIAHPSIALLSNGSEPYKGSIAVKQAYALLEKSGLLFVGNVESRDLFRRDIDVLVCDGFAGNILLKTIQGTVQAVMHWVKSEINDSLFKKMLFKLSGQKIINSLKKKTDYSQTGGALLLGLKKPLIVAHGCSDARAIENALIFAHQLVKDQFVTVFNAELSQTLFHYARHTIKHVGQMRQTIV